ncbi:coiled-coil domain-containing protein 39 isoform X1 [Schistocerca piceifrons]|uniref:coiled-coil domain-containing protein 39 isoform X1 n=2 Tax=Schistocerca piceifrons TaxID=274613 RepID=UPI001F5FE2E6|nr:coiled-coil domain-containing protein 39 isoform X1 [Schistocerca piceifrons]
MVKHIDDILAQIGWAEGFRVPGANEENKALEEEVEKKLKEKAKLSACSDELNDKINSLKKQVQTLNDAYNQNQALITANQRQLQTEDDLYRLAKAEDERLQLLMKDINKNLEDLEDRINSMQNDIVRNTDKLEKLKSNIKWDKESLTAWEEHVARKEEDNIMLSRYTFEDESKAKEMELKRQNLRMEVEEKKKMVIAAVNDVGSLEKSVERTAELFRKLHQERQELIDQWEASVRILHQRDHDISRVMEEMNLMRIEGREKLSLLEEQKNFFENEVSNNKELEHQISLVNQKLSIRRDESAKLAQALEDLMGECLIVRRTLSATGTQLDNQRSRNTQLCLEKESKQNRIDELRLVTSQLKKRLEKATDRTTTATEQAKSLEEMIEAEERALHAMERENTRARDVLFRVRYRINDLAQRKELQESEIKCVQSSKAQIHQQTQNLEKEAIRQEEILYGLDYEVQRLESRIARMKGKTDEESRAAEDEKLNEMHKILDEKTEKVTVLTAEVQRVDKSVHGLTTEVTKHTAELERLQGRRRDAAHLAEGGQRQLMVLKERSQERQLEVNMLQFRVSQAERALANEDNHVFSLERQQLELQRAMRDRQEEINMQQELLKIKKRVLEEEKSKLILEIQGRKLKTAQLQSKYEIAMMSLGRAEEGEEVSIATIKLKAAQEKYELQEQGDELDAKIRKAEKEILAMENTLKLVNASNDTYKKSLSSIDTESPEYQEKRELEAQYYSAVDCLRRRQAEISEINKDIELMEQTLQELLRAEDEIRYTWRDKDHEAAELDRELCDQQAKLIRAEEQLHRQQRLIRGSTRRSIEEKDIKTRELQEQNMSALQQLAELVARHVETGPVVSRYLVEKGLELPITARTQSSRSLAATSVSSVDEKSDKCDVSTPSSDRSSRTPTSPSVVTLDLPVQRLERTPRSSTQQKRHKKFSH